MIDLVEVNVPENSRIIERAAREVNGLSTSCIDSWTRQRRCIVSLILIWIVSAVGCESEDDRANALYQQANEQLKAGNLEQAVVLYRDLSRAEDLMACLGADGKLGASGEAVDLFIEDAVLVGSLSVAWP